MSSRALAPVRRAVPLRRGHTQRGQDALARMLGAAQVWLYRSGTDALQAVLSHCAVRCQGTLRSQVILPAYGCPDLVTACVGAGLQPCLVDVDADGWGYSGVALAAALSDRVAAVVAVNLLGLGDDTRRLRALISDPQIALVQDSAQYLPRTSVHWPGDFQTFSFGRGKPLNLLGGGAATVAPPVGSSPGKSLRATVMGSRLAAVLFNLATAPMAYGLSRRLPGLGIGTTCYRDPEPVQAAPERLGRQLDAALPEWVRQSSYDAGAWMQPLARWQAHGIAAYAAADGSGASRESLRLALLAPSAQMRDVLVERLARAGLGATALYATALPNATGMPDSIRVQGPFPHAEQLARRLFTLPTHAGTTAATIQRTDQIVREVAAMRHVS